MEQCGNGARCFVRFVHDQGLTAKRVIRVETLGGVIEPRLEDDGQVTVDMGVPRFEPAHDSLSSPTASAGAAAAGRRKSRWTSPPCRWATRTRCRWWTTSIWHRSASQGPLIENHPRFPQRVNAGFMQVVDRHAIRLRVYERGAGETLACGTGACAAVAAGIARGLLDSPVRVTTRGGDLTIAWAGPGQPVLMTGPAVTVFDEIEIEI